MGEVKDKGKLGLSQQPPATKDPPVFAKRFLTTLAVIGLTAAPVLAQGPSPASPGRPVPTTPSTGAPTPQTSRPEASTSTVPLTKKTNLNTASAAEIDALPEVGKARTKAIIDERAKGKFKDWADFDKRMSGTSVNAGVKAKIQDLVTF
jgi:competence protein ComEA